MMTKKGFEYDFGLGLKFGSGESGDGHAGGRYLDLFTTHTVYKTMIIII